MSPLVIPYPDFDPILVQIGPFPIRWYALAYIGGILLGWVYARAIIKRPALWGGKAPMTVLDYDDFILWATLGIILGGRLGQVLFYDYDFFFAHPLEIVMLWHGGMAFHGGFLGVVLAVLLFAWTRKIPILSLGDLTCAVVPIGLFLGRIANFINDELWGRPSNVPWAMIFPRAPDPLPRHPSQLYEAGLEGLCLLVVLGIMVRFGALRRRGLILGAFMVGYGIARNIAEIFREPDPQQEQLTHGLTMGMVLSWPMIAIGIGLILYALRRSARQS
ncbi:MAG TPA: prolipoprotein diacylglyceryl transferase [Pseudolabrys sp.]|nr:prolipoprotein diacylglyceryl transferase [Pseudolabrys sp.]